MNKEYKLIVSGKNIYHEIILNEKADQIYIGNNEKSDIYIDSDDEFSLFLFFNEEKEWELNCENNVYISESGVIKQVKRVLSHGDDFALKFFSINEEILRLRYVINFSDKKQDYRKCIFLNETDKKSIKIGGNNSFDVWIDDELMYDSEFVIIRNGMSFYIDKIRCRYGLYVNGNLQKNRIKINDFDFISVLGYSFYFKEGELRTTDSGAVVVNSLPCKVDVMTSGNCIYPRFYRNTRVVEKANDEKIKILSPPTEPSKPANSLFKTLIPAVVMLALVIVLRGVIGGGGMFVIFSACTMAVGIITSIATFIGERKKYKKKNKERKEKYEKYIDKKKGEIKLAREEEKKYLENMYYTHQQECSMVDAFSQKLFSCNAGDEDFLKITIGKGKVESNRIIDYKIPEQLEIEDELQIIPEQIANDYKYIYDAPITCNLADVNALGIVGDEFHVQDIVKNIIIDICTRHYHTDVRLVLIADDKKSEYIKWARYLPHLNEEKYRNIVCDEESRNLIFESVYKIISNREDTKVTMPHYVALVLDEMGIKSHPVSKYIENASDYGFTFVFFENHEERLPMGCRQIIRLKPNKREGELINSNDGVNKKLFEYRPISDSNAEKTAFKLAPVYTEEISLESSLVKNITLFELLNINNVNRINLKKRWSDNSTENSLAAPLGINAKGKIVYLDLHEKHHGPHGLVAGTTGSGKSELLQSYILSMATLYHPHEVSFMIIDFKGGGMVNQFKDLPHLIGSITNIDGKEIDRSLKSIKAELKKRQRCFAEANVNHIDAYIRKTKLGEVNEIIPHLIVIVDEFAELKAEQPEFMKELISAARIGRSLGVHLILATQKPAGQVNEQIWSNSKFKLCLKVQNKEDSNEVLKSPLAAEIKEPGRAYLQVGNNEIFELFQSAFSGAPADNKIENKRKAYKIYRVSLSGKREQIYEYKPEKEEGEILTQLKAMVDYISDYCKKENIKKLPSICMPKLPELIEYDEKNNDLSIGDYTVPIGIYDDPDNQYQGKAYVDLKQSNLLLIGSSQYGKTNFIQMMIRYFCSVYSPDKFNFYVIDFASRVLMNFHTLRHCGGVVCPNDDEKIKNLFKLLYSEMEVRKQKLLEIGVTSFASYLESGRNDMPLIMLIVENMTALKELYLNNNDQLINVCREGNSLGITVVISNLVTAGFGYRYLSNFSERLAFYCNDQSEYSGLFEHCKERPEQVIGRCIIEKNKKKYECQTYLSFFGDKEIEKINNIKVFINNVNINQNEKRAKMIPVVPSVLEESFFMSIIDDTKNTYKFPIGLKYSDVKPYYIDLGKIGNMAVLGKEKGGKTNFINYLIKHIFNNNDFFELYLIDNMEMVFENKCINIENLNYTYRNDVAEEFIKEIADKLKDRYERKISNEKQPDDEKFIVIINRNIDFINYVSENKALMAIYKEIFTKYKDMKVAAVHEDIPNISIQYGSPELLKFIKDNKKIVFFDDISYIKITEVNSSITRQFKREISLGDAFFINGNVLEKVKTVKCSK